MADQKLYLCIFKGQYVDAICAAVNVNTTSIGTKLKELWQMSIGTFAIIFFLKTEICSLENIGWNVDGLIDSEIVQSSTWSVCLRFD